MNRNHLSYSLVNVDGELIIIRQKTEYRRTPFASSVLGMFNQYLHVSKILDEGEDIRMPLFIKQWSHELKIEESKLLNEIIKLYYHMLENTPEKLV